MVLAGKDGCIKKSGKKIGYIDNFSLSIEQGTAETSEFEDQWKTFIGEFVTLVQTLRYHHYDLVIDFQGLFRSAFFARLTRGSRPIGFAQPREKLARIFYGTKLDVDMSLPAIERNVALVNKLLETNDPVPEAIPFLWRRPFFKRNQVATR